MFNIAIVEDDRKENQRIKDIVLRYAFENSLDIKVTSFYEGISLLENYNPIYDIIFMDIVMPGMDGYSVCKRIRKVDNKTRLVFLTSMSDYAIKGYDVQAVAFIEKPYTETVLTNRLNKIIRDIKADEGKYLLIKEKTSTYKVDIRDISFVEVNGHMSTFHTTDKDIIERKKISDVYAELKEYDFIQISAAIIVNPIYITSIDEKESTISIDDVVLPMSRSKKKDVINRFNLYLAKGSDIS